MDQNVALTTLDSLPLDPELEIPYHYSTTPNRQEFQLAATLANSDTPIALLEGDYASVSKNRLPTLLVATGSTASLDISTSNIQDLFIVSMGSHNLPYSLETGLPTSDGTSFSNLWSETAVSDTFWQNSDFSSCDEIEAAGKAVSDT